MKKIICNWLIVSLVPIVVSACDGDGKPEAAAPPAVPSASTFTQNDPGKAKPAVPVSDTKITAIVEPKGQELKPAIPPVDKPTPPGIAPVKEAAVPEIAPSAPIVDPADTRARKLVAQMTDDEKIGFTHTDAFVVAGVPGGGAAHIPGLARLGIPDLTMADSSIGAGSGQFPSTTFPATIGLAASWDGQLSYDYGVAIARQLRAQGFEMGLGGGANMVRDPRAGRLFEYLGEDPLLSGKLLAQRTKGTQSEKVIATIKHMVGNEQESWRGANPFDRVGISSIDERTLREIYMLPFEIAVEESEPGNVMCSYNKLRLEGDTQPLSACEHPHILTDILKHEWGFKGQVQSDWGATHSTAAAINAGLDEEEWAVPVPLPNFTPDKIKAALKDGSIKAERLNDMVQRKLRTMIKIGVMDDPAPDNSGLGFAPATDLKAGAALAQKVAEQSMVLLKNDGSQAPLKLPAAGTKLLPLDAGGLKRIAVIGGHADTAVLAGGGSGDTRVPSNGSFSSCGAVVYFSAPGCAWWVNPWKRVKTPILDAIADAAPDADVTYSGNSDEANPFRPYTDQEIADAVDAAAKAEVAIVVVHQMAGEDGDLKSLSLSNAGTMANPFAKVPNNQDMLVQRVAAANRNTIVIVESGNPVLMPWIGKVSAVLQAWYPGENGGKAIANILFGKVNPSGRLPVTFPVSDDQTPTLGKDFIPDPDYAEKLGVGYRWYDANRLQPLFEFGYGLSYTDFAYSGLRVDSASDGTRTVSFSVKNTGKVAGKETPQVYIEFPASAGEPPRRLAGWDKVDLQPGASKTVSMRISPKMQSIWDSAASQWKFVGASKVLVGASSRQMKLEL